MYEANLYIIRNRGEKLIKHVADKVEKESSPF